MRNQIVCKCLSGCYTDGKCVDVWVKLNIYLFIIFVIHCEKQKRFRIW